MVESVSRACVFVLTVLATGCMGAPSAWNASSEAATGEEALACSADVLVRRGPIDVALVIDASMSTRGASGRDIDGDGTLGDRDDSRLAAQIHAVRSLLEFARTADVRFSLVSFSGPMQTPVHPQTRVVSERQARIHEPLGAQPAALARALDGIAERGAGGTSDFYAGLRQANRALIEGEPGNGPRGRFVLFISDSHSPVTREPDGGTTAVDPHLEVAIRQAREHGIVFHTFGLGASSGEWRFDPIGWIAWETGGRYQRVEDAAALGCHLVNALADSKPGEGSS